MSGSKATLQLHQKRFGSTKKLTLSLTICVLVLLSFGLMLLPLAPSVRAEGLGSWTATTGYPALVEGSSCGASGGYIYCVGGIMSGEVNDSTFYARMSSAGIAGIGAWINTTPYPTTIYLSSCVISESYITCIGGLLTAGTETNAVYSAPVSSAGIGKWTSEASYPTDLEGSSCVVSEGYVTCVGGLTDIGVNTNMVYYASLSSGTVGAWTATTDYPINLEGESCVGTPGYITCVGGQYNPLVSGYVTSAVYYDSVSSGAVGAEWSSTTNATAALSFEPCFASAGYIYCIAGYVSGATGVHFDTISSGALGPSWTSTTTYPVAVDTLQCAVSGGSIYCVGGDNAAAYYSQIGSSATTTPIMSTSSNRSTPSSTSTQTPASSSKTGSAIPEFPFEFGFALLTTVVIVVSYFLARAVFDSQTGPHLAEAPGVKSPG